MKNELIIGIDLGTTNSAAAVVRDGEVQIIDIHGHQTMPSCAGIDPHGRLITGHPARNQLIARPEATVLSIKRKMGEETMVKLGDQEYSPEQISAFILAEIKAAAETALGCPVRKAVITVPAFFNDRQRHATQTAGELAGLEVVRIINEPTAAALAYRGDRQDDEAIVVYDLGGGTFDVSLVVVEQGIVEVKSSHGDTQLGGDDFDDLLVQHAAAEFKKQHGIALPEDPRIQRRLKLAMEAAKCRLSDEPVVSVREEYLTPTHHLDLELERGVYESLIAHHLERTLHCVHQSLVDGKIAPQQLDKVMLVGGATRTPLVHRILREKLKLEPRWEISPDLIVAMGAAIQGAIISGQTRRSILVDITPHTFSTVALQDDFTLPEPLICVPIINRNTPLPASKSEMFFTSHDGQQSIEVRVCQGEQTIPSANTAVGKFRVEGLEDAPEGNPIIINFNLDLNGILKVTATEKTTGLAKTVTMDTRGAKQSRQLDAARRHVQAILDGSPQALPDAASPPDQSTQAAQDLLATAKNLRQRAEQLLAKDTAGSDAVEIRTLLEQNAAAVKNRDWNTVQTKNEALSDLLFYLED